MARPTQWVRTRSRQGPSSIVAPLFLNNSAAHLALGLRTTSVSAVRARGGTRGEEGMGKERRKGKERKESKQERLGLERWPSGSEHWLLLFYRTQVQVLASIR